MFGGANEALWIMLGGSTIGGIWGIWSWKIRRKDQKADKAESNAVKDISIAKKAETDKILSDIKTTSARVDKIERGDMITIEGRLTALESLQVGYKEIKDLFESSLESHLLPLIKAEERNTEELLKLKNKMFELELTKEIEAKYKGS